MQHGFGDRRAELPVGTSGSLTASVTTKDSPLQSYNVTAQRRGTSLDYSFRQFVTMSDGLPAQIDAGHPGISAERSRADAAVSAMKLRTAPSSTRRSPRSRRKRPGRRHYPSPRPGTLRAAETLESGRIAQKQADVVE